MRVSYVVCHAQSQGVQETCRYKIRSRLFPLGQCRDPNLVAVSTSREDNLLNMRDKVCTILWEDVASVGDAECGRTSPTSHKERVIIDGTPVMRLPAATWMTSKDAGAPRIGVWRLASLEKLGSTCK